VAWRPLSCPIYEIAKSVDVSPIRFDQYALRAIKKQSESSLATTDIGLQQTLASIYCCRAQVV
jgi:hypothetical protein